jgi:hypothetical protein
METYVATLCLVRDRGVSDEELMRAFSDWKRMKAGGKHPLKWVQVETPDTPEGIFRLLFASRQGDRSIHFGISTRGDRTVVCACFVAEAGRTPFIAQALSFMAFGFRPGTYLDIGRSQGPGVSRRRYVIVLNGDGEPEVEEVVLE